MLLWPSIFFFRSNLQLSLNKKDEICGHSLPLADVGIVGGDMLYVIVSKKPEAKEAEAHASASSNMVEPAQSPSTSHDNSDDKQNRQGKLFCRIPCQSC